MLLSETQVKVNVRIYTSAFVHSISTSDKSSALPSDLLRRSSAVVIEQAHCYKGLI